MMIQDFARKTHAKFKSLLGQHLMLLSCVAPIKTKLVVHGTLSSRKWLCSTLVSKFKKCGSSTHALFLAQTGLKDNNGP